ncbi:hypothetical protein GCM10028793_63880 [Nocardiopsis oceani]
MCAPTTPGAPSGNSSVWAGAAIPALKDGVCTAQNQITALSATATAAMTVPSHQAKRRQLVTSDSSQARVTL